MATFVQRVLSAHRQTDAHYSRYVHYHYNKNSLKIQRKLQFWHEYCHLYQSRLWKYVVYVCVMIIISFQVQIELYSVSNVPVQGLMISLSITTVESTHTVAAVTTSCSDRIAVAAVAVAAGKGSNINLQYICQEARMRIFEWVAKCIHPVQIGTCKLYVLPHQDIRHWNSP